MAGGSSVVGSPLGSCSVTVAVRADSRGWSYGSRDAGAFSKEHFVVTLQMDREATEPTAKGGSWKQNAVCVLVAVCVLGCCVCVLGRCGVACCWPCVYKEEVGSSRSTLQTEMKVNMSTYCRKKSEYENIFRSSELGKVKAW